LLLMIFVVICWTQVLPRNFSAHIEKKTVTVKKRLVILQVFS
jgi:hypothetical protein